MYRNSNRHFHVSYDSKTGHSVRGKGTVLFVDGWFSVDVAPLIWKHSDTDRQIHSKGM